MIRVLPIVFVSDLDASIRFYQALQAAPQQHKAQALQQAQQGLIEAGWEHPFYWSAFTLIGHWR